MDIVLRTRPLYASELRALKAIRKINEKELRHPRRYYYILFCAMVVALALRRLFDDEAGMFTIVAIAVATVSLCIPYFIVKQVRETKAYISNLTAAIEKGTVDTYVINATRVAKADDLYIVEYSTNNILYLWDLHQELQYKSLSTQFEIYENDFACLVRRLVYHKGERIKPILVSYKYFIEKGPPAQLQTDAISFDELLVMINQIA